MRAEMSLFPVWGDDFPPFVVERNTQRVADLMGCSRLIGDREEFFPRRSRNESQYFVTLGSKLPIIQKIFVIFHRCSPTDTLSIGNRSTVQYGVFIYCNFVGNEYLASLST